MKMSKKVKILVVVFLITVLGLFFGKKVVDSVRYQTIYSEFASSAQVFENSEFVFKYPAFLLLTANSVDKQIHIELEGTTQNGVKASMAMSKDLTLPGFNTLDSYKCDNSIVQPIGPASVNLEFLNPTISVYTIKETEKIKICKILSGGRIRYEIYISGAVYSLTVRDINSAPLEKEAIGDFIAQSFNLK